MTGDADTSALRERCDAALILGKPFRLADLAAQVAPVRRDGRSS